MDRLEIGLLGIAVSLFFIALRVPVGVVLGIVAFIGISSITSLKAAWGILTAIPHNFVAQWTLSAIPMFLLMGYIAARTGLTVGIFSSARILFGRVPGGLASATVMASSIFAAASGSSVATAAAFSRIAVPEMLKAKYDPGLATGSVAAAGTLGSLIPPSVLLILYGIFTETSIGALFLAGVIPGILSAVIYISMIMVRSYRTPEIAPPDLTTYSAEEKKAAFRDIWPLPTLILGVLGGILLGVFSPTEAGAIGAATAAIIALVRGALTREALSRTLTDTAIGTATIFVIAISASMFASFMGLSTVPTQFAGQILSVVESPVAIIIALSIIFIVLGMFLDGISLLLLTTPIMLPILKSAGIDMVWFGIIAIKLIEIGLITPPVGINIYVIKSVMGRAVPLGAIFRGAFWFIAMDIMTLGILIAFPVVTLFLPGLMR